MFGRLLSRATKTAGLFVILFAAMPVKADLILGTPPWGSEEQMRAIFEPVAEAMSEWIGTRVVYSYANNFSTYSFAMRGGRYDMVFDGPAFNAWRVKNVNHDVLVKLPGTLEFFVVSDKEGLSSADDLVGRRVCGQAPPQFGILSFLSEFQDPLRQPVLQVLRDERRIYEDLVAGKCETALLRNSSYRRMTDEEKARYKVVFATRPAPNQAISAGPNVTAEQRRILVEKLTDASHAHVFGRLLQMATHFERADSREYAGFEKLLESASYGW